MDDTLRAPATRPLSTPRTPRSLAPDLARGSALLGIALANSVYYVTADAYGTRSRPLGGSWWDKVVDLLLVTFVDGRWLPLFAGLFGYGAVQYARRQTASGRSAAAARALNRRRFLWLIVFGLAHLLLLFGGDILAIYGILGCGLLFALGASDRRLLVGAGVVLVAAVPLAVLVSLPPFESSVRNSVPSLLVDDPWEALVSRVTAWPLDLVLLSSSAFAPMLVGVWAARRGLMDDPGRHRALLRRTALVGIPVGAAGGVPLALIAAEVLSAGFPTILLASVLHALSGFALAAGGGAAAGLWAARTSGRRGPVTRALAATGRRSLTCYLAQSVVFVVLFAPYAGGLGDDVGTAAMAAAASVTWLATVLAADLAGRAGRQGPAEALLRRLA